MQPPHPLFDTLSFLSQQKSVHPSIKEKLPEAESDFAHAHAFLSSYQGSSATFNAYRREVERLLHWSWLVQKTSIRSLTATDIESFMVFCQSPPKNWIGLSQEIRFINQDGTRKPNPAWRPFIATVSKAARAAGKSPEIKDFSLSQSALQAIFSILSSFYNYLIQADYATRNPITQVRQKSRFLRRYQGKRQIRRLSELQWSYVIESAEILAAENPSTHERTLFIMKALFGMYLRISELSASPRWQPQMGHFYRDIEGNWWFKTVGKGNKERDISVSDAMLTTLKRYRKSRELSPLPTPGESTPLICQLKSSMPLSGTRHIRKIVQFCFNHAIERLIQSGFTEDANQLMSATVHWLRHTGISEDVKYRPREHVRDDAGHSSSAITDLYIDIERRERHASAKKKVILPDETIT